MKIIYFVNCYNEEKNLMLTINTIFSAIKQKNILNYELIIMNDGSTDKTLEIANQLKKNNKQIKIISNIKNKGVAKNLKSFISNNHEGILLPIPGDNDFDINLLKNLSAVACSKKINFAISYFINKEVRTRSRNFISNFYNSFLNFSFDVNAFYLDGPCVWPLKNVSQFNLQSTGITIVSEINIKLLKSGLTYIEIPYIAQSTSLKSSTYTFTNFLRAISGFIKLFIEIKLSSKYKLKSTKIYE
jgi:glycosyltransferase involved in cell wall biosynthesis